MMVRPNHKQLQAEEVQLAKVPEVAKHLNVHRATVYRMIQRGLLPCVRISDNVRVPWSSVRLLVSKQLAQTS